MRVLLSLENQQFLSEYKGVTEVMKSAECLVLALSTQEIIEFPFYQIDNLIIENE